MIINKYSIVKDENQLKIALSLAKGRYQRNLLNGVEAISGATLAGKAKEWSGKYKQSANNLIKRLKVNNVLVAEQIGDHGKRILVIG